MPFVRRIPFRTSDTDACRKLAGEIMPGRAVNFCNRGRRRVVLAARFAKSPVIPEHLYRWAHELEGSGAGTVVGCTTI